MPKTRAKLAMRWYNDPGRLQFDVYAGTPRAEWFQFLSAPGTTAIRIQAQGKVEAWIDGDPMKDKGNGRFEASLAVPEAAIVTLRILPRSGYCGGAVIPEPVIVETGSGIMPLGDWSKAGVLDNYSGGVRYQTSVELTEAETGGKMELDLGSVVATAEVHVNGKKAGIRVAPPWRVDVTGLLKTGKNSIEVLVYNTLSNHYQTIPSNYRGSPTSGLMGPVRLIQLPPK
jgi:hypothetical protein